MHMKNPVPFIGRFVFVIHKTEGNKKNMLHCTPTDSPVECLSNAEGVRNREASFAARDAPRAVHCQERGKHHESRPESFQP